MKREPGPSVRAVPEGDERARLICPDCGYVQYDNPKIVVGAICHWEDRILLCRRAIAPRSDFWVLPAGYLEINETTEMGAIREAKEEAGADTEILSLLALYNIRHLSQVQFIYRARLRSPALNPGRESKEARLFRWAEIPWNDLAFPSVGWALRHDRDVAAGNLAAPCGNPPGDDGNL